MDKEEFILGYCERSEITREYFDMNMIALPCACDYKKCEGWAAISNSPDMIKDHMELYAPKER